jgi:nucleoside-diphosphate-sugar epimerase
MKVLIVGCGYVGTALAQLFLKQSAQVFALQRKPVNIPGVQNILCDIANITAQDIPEVELVYYLISANAATPEGYRNAYVDGVAQLITALKGHKIKKLIYVSSTAVYGQQLGEWVDERSETAPVDFSGKLLLTGEQQVRSSNIPYTIVRLAGIYGPGRDKLIQSVKNQQAKLIPMDAYTNRIHVQDCAGILAHVANHVCELILGVDCQPLLYNELLCMIAEQLHAPIPAMGDEVPARLKKSNKRCSNKKILSLGYHFMVPTYKDYLRPNKETRAAMEEHKAGKLKTYDNYDEMMKDIDKE